jgi:PAS domain S-box-containing protein
MNEDTKEKEGLYRSIFESATDGMMIIDLETSLMVEANPAAWLMHGYARNEFLELQLQACIHPDSQYVFNESLQIFRSTGVFDIRALHVCRNGTTFFADWRGAPFTYEGRPCLLGIIRDVSNQIQMEQSLSQRVEVRTHEQATLLEISHTLASTLELQPGLILDQLRKIIKYSHGGLFALEVLRW